MFTMRPFLQLSFAVILASSLGSSLVHAQAVVNENLETVILYVDVLNGSDSNPGTQLLPFKTIAKSSATALKNKHAKLGTKVIINPGVYRESFKIEAAAGDSDLPITFESAQSGTVQFSGAVQYTNWTPYSKNSNVYTTPWTYNWKTCPVDGNGAPFEPEIVLHREGVFVNSTQMTQVLSLNQVIYPGTFYVDESTNLMYVWPPAGTNMDSADVEVSIEQNLLTIQGPHDDNLNGIVFRGIQFVYASTCHAQSAVHVLGNVTNLLFDNDSFLWNNGQGLYINTPANGVTVMNSVANHNGASGFASFQVKNILWQNDQASYNNWRGAQGAYYDWNTAGAHFFSDHYETLSGFTAIYNQAKSIHWDTDNANTTVTGLLASENLLGALYEANEGPLTISRSRICSSLTDYKGGYGGLTFRNSENATVTGSAFYDNADSQILITGVAGGILVTNWETGQTYDLVSQNINMTGNVIEGTTASQQLFKDSYLGGADWTTFVTTLVSNNNSWWNPANTLAFTVPMPRSGTALDFQDWQKNTGVDINSVWAAPTKSPVKGCTVTAATPDFWLLLDDGVVSIKHGSQATFNLTTVSLAGLAGTVTLSTESSFSIPGATLTFSPATVSTSGASVFTVATTATTPAGTYNFTILANTGSITHTVAISLTIT